MKLHISLLLSCLISSSLAADEPSAYLLNSNARLPLAVSQSAWTDDPNETLVPLPNGFTYHIPKDNIDFPSAMFNTTSSLFTWFTSRQFVPYEPYFIDVIGSKPSGFQILGHLDSLLTSHGAAWVPESHEVWLTATTLDPTVEGAIKGSIQIINLDTGYIHQAILTENLVGPRGIIYFRGHIFVACTGDESNLGGIYVISPATGKTRVLVNSFFGTRFNGIIDLVAARDERTHRDFLYFSDAATKELYDGGRVKVDRAIWRYDPQNGALSAVHISRDLIYDGLAISKDHTKIYFTAYSEDHDSSRRLYVCDLDRDMFPVNKRLLTLSTRGAIKSPQGDSLGNIWAVEGGAISLRRASDGVLLGEMKNASSPFSTLVLAGDKVVATTQNRIWTLTLTRGVIDPKDFGAVGGDPEDIFEADRPPENITLATPP